MATKRHVYEVYIRTTPARLWEAITKFEVVRRYYYGYGLRARLRKGAPLEYVDPDTGKVAIAGKVLEVVPRKRFVHTFQFRHDPKRLEPPSRVTYTISKWQGVPLLRLVHDRLEKSPRTGKSVEGGWGPILSGLKSLLETGKPLWK
ncbi:MAG: SRPBCC domain-containing protein [Planctomycetales bacterium]|nr:SRPBCC domain-containing protein [Planctomycetales bacterium]